MLKFFNPGIILKAVFGGYTSNVLDIFRRSNPFGAYVNTFLALDATPYVPHFHSPFYHFLFVFFLHPTIEDVAVYPRKGVGTRIVGVVHNRLARAVAGKAEDTVGRSFVLLDLLGRNSVFLLGYRFLGFTPGLEFLQTFKGLVVVHNEVFYHVKEV